MIQIGIIGKVSPSARLGEIITGQTTCIFSGTYLPHADVTKDPAAYASHPVFSSFEAFLSNCDAVIVDSIDGIMSTDVESIIKSSKHLLLAKPMGWDDEEIEYLFKLAEEANTHIQLREPFLFHPVIIAADPFIHAPAFIDYQIDISSEAPNHKLPDLITDSIVQCLDAIFCLNHGRISKYTTVFSPDLFGFPGVIHGRIEFDNGCIANITCNGYAEQDKAVCYIYQENRHAILNFLNKRLVIKDRTDEEKKPKSFSVPLKNYDPEVEEILAFTGTILNKSYHLSSPERYFQSFKLARKMLDNLPIRELQF